MCGIGLIADARGRRTHDIVEQALAALVRLTHRGAPPDTASIDGSGILTQIPWPVLADDLPAVFTQEHARRALGMFFMPRGRVAALKDTVAAELHRAGFTGCCWRTVPVSFESFDRRRTADLPAIVQVAVIASDDVGDPDSALYRVRQRIESATTSDVAQGFAVVSLSSRTVVYKGLLTPAELGTFYLDLREPAFRSAIAIVHQRFCTNTGARWGLAPPYESTHDEPWDGPAAVAFTDGAIAGALLDRNGFHPARFIQTRDDRIYLGSEAGIFDVPSESILSRGRLGPGGLLIVDTERGEILDTAAVRTRLASERPYRKLLAQSVITAAST